MTPGAKAPSSSRRHQDTDEVMNLMKNRRHFMLRKSNSLVSHKGSVYYHCQTFLLAWRLLKKKFELWGIIQMTSVADKKINVLPSGNIICSVVYVPTACIVHTLWHILLIQLNIIIYYTNNWKLNINCNFRYIIHASWGVPS